DIERSAQFLALIPIEHSERNVDTSAKCVGSADVVERAVMRIPSAESRIRGAVSHCQFVICFGLFNRLLRFFQIGALMQGNRAKLIERSRRLGVLEFLRHVEIVDRCTIPKQGLEIDLRGSEVDSCGSEIRYKLNALQVQALKIHVCDGAACIAVPI